MRYPLILLSLLFSTQLIIAQDWDIPEERIDRLSGFEFTDATISAGENIYNLNCKLCHGDPGKANFQALDPVPGDPATDKIQDNSDGSLQYKISEGRGLMPSFKRVLSADEIWNVISYIRSFNPDYTQSVALARKLTNLKWSVIKILVNHVPGAHQVSTKLIGLEGEHWTPVPDAEVSLFAKRYFGTLVLDVPKLSNENGEILFDIPHDLPGDKNGDIEVIIGLMDTELFGNISKDTLLNIGIASLEPPLNKERAMWNVSRKAPIWLMIAYPGVVLSVWGIIFFVLFRLRTVYRLGEDKD